MRSIIELLLLAVRVLPDLLNKKTPRTTAELLQEVIGGMILIALLLLVLVGAVLLGEPPSSQAVTEALTEQLCTRHPEASNPADCIWP